MGCLLEPIIVNIIDLCHAGVNSSLAHFNCLFAFTHLFVQEVAEVEVNRESGWVARMEGFFESVALCGKVKSPLIKLLAFFFAHCDQFGFCFRRKFSHIPVEISNHFTEKCLCLCRISFPLNCVLLDAGCDALALLKQLGLNFFFKCF